MPTFEYAKLVRDNIPGWHHDRGHAVDGWQLNGEDLKLALCKKLQEEADEVKGAISREELIEELGDIQQIVDDICTTQNISKDEVYASLTIKTKRRGGFIKGEYINTVRMEDENDKWVKYCRQFPEKYPEVA